VTGEGVIHLIIREPHDDSGCADHGVRLDMHLLGHSRGCEPISVTVCLIDWEAAKMKKVDSFGNSTLIDTTDQVCGTLEVSKNQRHALQTTIERCSAFQVLT